jgi:hypothetical protein
MAQMALSHSQKKATYLNEIWVIQRMPVHLPVCSQLTEPRWSYCINWIELAARKASRYNPICVTLQTSKVLQHVHEGT